MKIVVVDDDQAIRDALIVLFSASPHQVSVYSSARDLLFNGFEPPDVFLIDWLIPEINGLDLCRRLKNDPITRTIPVVIMTAAQYLSHDALAAGAETVVSKPFKKNELLAVLEGLVSPTD